MRSQTDILVVGGGVVGVCTAYYLTDLGYHVTVIDRNDFQSGCSHGNPGLVAPSRVIPLASPNALGRGLRHVFNIENPFYIRPRPSISLISWLWRFARACSTKRMRETVPMLHDLYVIGMDLYEELNKHRHLNFNFVRKGRLKLYKTERGYQFCMREARLSRVLGFESKVVPPNKFLEFDPNLKTTAAGGLHFPNDAQVDPQALVRDMAKDIKKRGADLRSSTEVLGFDTFRGKVSLVRTTRGEFKANQIILATGAWAPAIADLLGVSMPVEPAKGYGIIARTPANPPAVPITLQENALDIVPTVDGLRIAGTIEFAGYDMGVNLTRLEGIQRTVKAWLPELGDLDVLETWRGLRPCTPDGLPIISRVPSLDNVVIATGHAHAGVALGPVTGFLVAQLVAGDVPALDLTPLSVDRFR